MTLHEAVIVVSRQVVIRVSRRPQRIVIVIAGAEGEGRAGGVEHQARHSPAAHQPVYKPSLVCKKLVSASEGKLIRYCALEGVLLIVWRERVRGFGQVIEVLNARDIVAFTKVIDGIALRSKLVSASEGKLIRYCA